MLYGLLNIGQSALNASQAWISVTGNNLANADTEGYSRQYVDQRDAGGLTTKPGAQGLGVNAQQIMRFFDSFLERSYVRQATNSARWDEQDTIMTSLENIFNESNRSGLSSSLNKFFTAWQDLALRPEDTATRESLLSYADNLSDMFGSTMDGIKAIQKEMDVSIGQTVDRVNDLSKAIADLNRQITSNTVDGVSNPNSLLDKRDQLVRELASLADVETIDNGKGNFRVQLTTGQPLVDGQSSYELRVMGPQAENRLTADSAYRGSVQFDGADSHEYTVEIVNGGSAGDVPPPQFRVSLDGGKTWLRDDDGKELRFDITDSDGDGTTDQVLVKNLKISFSAADNFHAGDKFDITPKDGLYWIEPTRGPENITPQVGFDGTDNLSRLTGGKLAAYYNIRDDNCGRYMDELNAVASSLIWEVNRIHSQGSGLSMLDYAQGQQRVEDITKAWGRPSPYCPSRTSSRRATSISISTTRPPATTNPPACWTLIRPRRAFRISTPTRTAWKTCATPSTIWWTPTAIPSRRRRSTPAAPFPCRQPHRGCSAPRSAHRPPWSSRPRNDRCPSGTCAAAPSPHRSALPRGGTARRKSSSQGSP